MASEEDQSSSSKENGRCNAFNNFCSEMSSREDIKKMAPRTRFAVFSREWRALSVNDKAKYNRRVKTPMDLKKRKRKWQKTFTKICKSINTLQSLIPETEAIFLLSLNKSIPTCAGTNSGIEFIEGEEGTEMLQKFHTFMKRETTGISGEVTLKKIQNLFNSKFSEASGIVGGRMPYSANSVQMVGLPDGIPFKRPSHYGKNQRQKIWSARASLRCHINDAESSR